MVIGPLTLEICALCVINNRDSCPANQALPGQHLSSRQYGLILDFVSVTRSLVWHSVSFLSQNCFKTSGEVDAKTTFDLERDLLQ